MGSSSRRRRRDRSPSSSEEHHHRRRRSASGSRRRRRDEEGEVEEARSSRNRKKRAAFGRADEEESEDHAGGVSLTSIMKDNPKLSVQEALAKLVIMKQMSGAPLPMGGGAPAQPQTMAAVPASLPGILPGGGNSSLAASNPAAAAALAAASMPAALQLNKAQREVYAKNLPRGVSAHQLEEFLTTIVTTLKKKLKRVITHTWLSADGTIGFCETKSVEDAKALIECCDGVAFAGSVLEVGRPKEVPQDVVDSAPSQNHQQIMTVSHTLMLINVPKHLTPEEIQESLILPFGDIEAFNVLLDQQGKSKGSVIFRYADEKRASKAIAALSSSPSSPGVKLGDERLEIQRVPLSMVDTLLKPVKPGELVPTSPHDSSKPSQILCVRDLVNDDDLADEQAHNELVDELLEECGRYATVLRLLVPRLDLEPCIINKKNKNNCSGLGLVFVEYSSIDDATQALWNLRNRTVDGTPINVSFYPRDLYKKDILHSLPIPSSLYSPPTLDNAEKDTNHRDDETTRLAQSSTTDDKSNGMILLAPPSPAAAADASEPVDFPAVLVPPPAPPTPPVAAVAAAVESRPLPINEDVD